MWIILYVSVGEAVGVAVGKWFGIMRNKKRATASLNASAIITERTLAAVLDVGSPFLNKQLPSESG